MNIYKGPEGLKLELDPTENYEGGTPALVVFPNGDTGTYNCVTGEGETADGTRATDSQLEWLRTFEDKIDQIINEN